MKKTYATSMPNHIGSFLKASKCFAALGINITRVSYDTFNLTAESAEGPTSLVLNQAGDLILQGDKVTVELSPYDLNNGRITWRSK